MYKSSKFIRFFTTNSNKFNSNCRIQSIAVIGIGGVGGYYGGKLASAYAESEKYKINFVARGAHFERIRTNGLELITTNSKYLLSPTKIVKDFTCLTKQDLIILAVKSYDMRDIFEGIKHISHQNTYLLPLLNGVNIREELEKHFSSNNIIDACVYLSSNQVSPGIVKQSGGSGELLFGTPLVEKNKLNEIKEIFDGAKIFSTIREDITSVVWQKYIFVCPMSCMTVAYGINKKTILSNEFLLDELKQLMKEIVVVATKKGVVLPPNIVELSIDKINKIAPSTIPSMQWDYEHQQPLELDIFPVYIISQAKLLSINIPYHQTIYERLKERVKLDVSRVLKAF